MKTIYIHIGRGKTGTTSIQSFLGHCTKELSSAGIHYVRNGGGAAGGGHQDFAKSFILEMPDYMIPPKNAAETQALIGQELVNTAHQKVLLSSENFEIASPRGVKEFLDRLGLAYQVKIIFFVRSQDEIIESEYNQMVKLKGETRAFEIYAKESLDSLNYLKTAELWGSVFGSKNIVCRVYQANSDQLINDFLDCIDIPNLLQALPDMKNVRAVKLNTAVGHRALCAVRLINQTGMEETALKSSIFEFFKARDLPALHFSAASARRYRLKFALNNLKFSIKFLGKLRFDLGGRRYSDRARDEIRKQIRLGEGHPR